MRLRNIFIGLGGVTAMAMLAACGNDSARISGHFIGAASQPVYLERVMPGATTPHLDTVITNDKGEFSFRVELPGGQPTIFDLKYDDDSVPLLISPREKVNVMSLGDLDGYQVSGSPESELVWRLHGILSRGVATLDSISQLYPFISTEVERVRIKDAMVKEYRRIKNQHIAFIVENSSSLAAVYALYQRLPGDEVLSDAETDHIYYQSVADSVSKKYPDSRYVQALKRDVASMIAQRELQNRISAEGIPQIDYPEIELPDMYGQKIKLSSLAGKVIVIDFWSAADNRSPVNNAEMQELWKTYSDAGLAIYQVSLDTDKSLWVNTVLGQKLPWITVCDFRGEMSSPVTLYNITSLPANYVIDRQGSIAGKNLYGDALAKKIEELVN